MPNEKEIDPRALASWRVRACAAGLCTGAQIFLAGCAVGMPIALSSAWLAASPAALLALFLATRSRRTCCPNVHGPKIRYIVLALVLLSDCVFACASMAGYAAQTLTVLTRTAWTQTLALIAVALCALSGGAGVSRLCFALRYALPALTLGLSLAAVPMRVPVGLFPILGAGVPALGAAAACMLFAASPALMLMLPAPDLEAAQRSAVPKAGFFLRRMLPGVLAGGVLLFFSCACTTYESIAASTSWGARLRLAAGSQAHEGVQQMLLALAKLMAMLLLSANMLCAAQQALAIAFPALGRASLGLLILLAALALAASIILGDGLLLTAVPLIAVPAVLLALFPGRGRDA